MVNDGIGSNNVITEVLEDGTIYHFDLDLCDDAAEDAINSLWEKEDTVLNFDFSSAIFSTFVKTIGILSRSGWTTQELFQEVANHSEAEDNVCDYCGERFNDLTIDHNHDNDDDDYDDDE